MGEVDALAQKLNCQVIPADATSVEDLQNVIVAPSSTAAFKACTIGSIGATPTPPPAQTTVPKFSMWVAKHVLFVLTVRNSTAIK